MDAFAKQTGISAAWGRIFWLYGPHEREERLVASLIQSLLRGSSAACSHGNQIRDFLFVQDVADAFASLVESKTVGPVNIGSGIPVAVKDIIHKIGVKTGRGDLIQMGVLPVRANDPARLVADVTILRQEVGWAPKYDLDEGLDETIKWWKHQSVEARSIGQL